MNQTTTTKKSNFELEKEEMSSWLNFISMLNQTKEHEAEKTLKIIHEALIKITGTGLFAKDNFLDENEKFFVSSFSPSFIKKISNEYIINTNIKEIVRRIIQIYIDEFIKHLENHNCQEIWESLI